MDSSQNCTWGKNKDGFKNAKIDLEFFFLYHNLLKHFRLTATEEHFKMEYIYIQSNFVRKKILVTCIVHSE